MENILKKPYEISLWDDDLVFRVKYIKNNQVVDIKEYFGSLKDFVAIEGTTTEITQYYKERKICVIGSDTMQTPIRAVNGKLISNVNGANTLTFSLYSKYWDEEAKQFFDNPFLKLLVNERKIKLRHGILGASDCKWYDLVIKNIQEKSESKLFTYTAKDLFVNELSKSGFELELDPELENNTGNITTLAGNILEGSDWKLGKDNSLLIQTKEEPLYEIILNRSLTVKNMKNNAESITIASGKKIYGFYTPIVNKESYFQLLYVNDGFYEHDDDYVITNSKNWYCEGATYTDDKPDFAKTMSISSVYRGDRIVRSQKMVYDSTIDKYVSVYNDGAYYGYTESEYISPASVKNLVTSPNGFVSFSGWEVGAAKYNGSTIYPSLELQGFPDLRDVSDISAQDYISLLKFTNTDKAQKIFNSGIADHKSSIECFSKDEEYVIRFKYATATLNANGRPKTLNYQNAMPTIVVGSYELNDGIYSVKKEYFSTSGVSNSYNTTENFNQMIVKCKSSLSYSQMLKEKLGIFINFNSVGTFYIEDFQFFKYVKDTNGSMVTPDSELVSTVKTKYYYYIPNKNYESLDDVEYVYQGYEPMIGASQDYNDNEFEKVRSITAKESNRFNLIQTLCETFECWAKFEIEHNPITGEILLDEEDGYRQKKWITFREYIGKKNYSGFKYGINLKSIDRTLDSAGAISKIIVKNNANEFAENGFCSIGRSSESPTGENFIYDFSYYVQQGLVGFSEISNDLYLDTNGYLGYYKKLKTKNREREELIEEQAGLLTDISELQAQHQTYKISVDNAQEELRAVEISIYNLTGLTCEQLLKEKDNKWWSNTTLIQKTNSYAQLKNTIARHKKMRDLAEANLTKAQNRYDEITSELEGLAQYKRNLNLQFYKKYSRFIQEGSWIKEDYVDDNLYYLDAESTLHTSSQPKVTYNINVLELSQLEGYENYSYELGDITYMEDTEFFGWTYKNGVKTPYQEEIIVSEFTTVLDSPEQNQIKVQNYKTQFEDLFQRITATTQAAEYHTGEYTRAAGIVDTDGNIVVETLQNSIANNAIRLENAKDQTVFWDESGITTTSLSKPNEIIRLVSGGLFLSVDGGITWSTGITGSGINATYITTGNINTGVINILNDGIPSFRWDGSGLNAYQFQVDQTTGQPYGFNIAKFVRFDQYGIYGINGDSDFDPNISNNNKTGEDRIWEEASYALTWKGFMLKNNDGSVRITSTNDIQVLEGEVERIKIGRIEQDSDEVIYGIRISNAEGAPVMETDDQGELWLKNKLRVETYDSNKRVSIGRVDTEETKDAVHGGKILNANNKFIVYEDGHMVAQSGEFYGKIYATGGQIGGLTVDQWAEKGYDLVLTSNKGNSMKNGTAVTLTAQLYHGSDTVSGVTYEWYDLNNENIILHTGQQYNITVDFTNGFVQYGCKATMS